MTRLQTLQKFTLLFLTEMLYGAKHWTNLECKLYFLETIVLNDIMETNFLFKLTHVLYNHGYNTVY